MYQVYYNPRMDVMGIAEHTTISGFGPSCFMRWYLGPYDGRNTYVLLNNDNWILIGDFE